MHKKTCRNEDRFLFFQIKYNDDDDNIIDIENSDVTVFF